MCKLCQLVEDRKFITKKYYEDAYFMIIDCRTCKTPMLVSKEHVGDVDEANKTMAYHLFYKNTSRIDMSKWYVDYKMKTNPLY